MVSVTVWNEFVHEQEDDAVAEVYPDGIHTTIADALAGRGHDTRTATLEEPEHGLTEAVLEDTDVLVWWGHAAHHEVDDEVVERVAERVHDGMGLIVLHSAHASKPFKRLLGTPCDLTWREADERERLWVVDPGHPIADGLSDALVFDEVETYGEPFGIPNLTGWSLPPGSRAARCSAAGVASGGAAGGSSTSDPATRPIPSTTATTSSGCSTTPSGGRPRPREPTPTPAIATSTLRNLAEGACRRATARNPSESIVIFGRFLFGRQRHRLTRIMGFGSYDESEQENQEYDTDFDDEDGLDAAENTHEGDVEYEFTASNDELLDRLKDIKEDRNT